MRSATPFRNARRPASHWLVLTGAGLLLLAGCGGGFLGIFDEAGNEPPTMSLAAAPSPVARGQTLQLVAAASDDDGIDEVAFYSVATDGALTRLGSDGEAPYLWSQTVASDASGTLRYQARATDTDGKSTDSQIVEVAITE